MNSDILDRLKKGEASAYQQLFDDYYIQLTGFAYRIVHDEEVAKDVVQNIFVRIFQNRESLTIGSSLKSYLYRAVSNECLNEKKGSTRRNEHHFLYAEHSLDADHQQAYEKNEREYRVFRAIDQLPPKCKKIFLMSRIGGKKNQEIASELGISIRTVETQISNAIKSLKQVVKALYCLIFPFFSKKNLAAIRVFRLLIVLEAKNHWYERTPLRIARKVLRRPCRSGRNGTC